MAERSLRFDLIARDKSFSKTLDDMGRKGTRLNRQLARAMGDGGDRSGALFSTRLNKRLGGGFSASVGIARRAAGAVGAAFAVAGIAQFAKDSIMAAATFDKTMRQVAAVADVPTAQIKELREVALDMGATTSFSARQAGEAMLELGKGGLSFAEQKAGALQSTLTLAAAGGLELGSAAGFVVQGLRAFGLRAGKAADVAAALAGAANASTSSVDDMGLALAQTAAGARNAGLSIEETTGVLAAFANNGIKGSDAGTSLKTMLQRLIPETERARDKMAELGLKFTDAHGAMLPITNIAEQLKDKLGGLSDAQRSAALATIFGSDATRAATILMREGAEGLAKYIKATSDRRAAEKLAKTNTEGAAGAFERLKGAIETLQIVIGDAFLPKLADLAEWLADKIPTALDDLQAKLRIARDWWQENADVIAALGDALNTIFVPAADNATTGTDDMRSSAERLKDSLDSILEVSLRAAQGFNFVAQVAGIVAMGFWDLVVAGGKVINVVDKLSGGTGHAADEMVDFARDMRDKTSKSLDKLAQDAKDTQRAIDKMHGKNINITGSLKLNFSPSFTQKDWVQVRLAAGRMAEGGLVRGPGGPTGDRIPALLSDGEFVVNAAAVRTLGVDMLRQLNATRFAAGGFVGQIDTESRAVNKVQARGTGRRMDAGISNLLRRFGGSAGIKAFILAADALPYIWGGAGPFGYDCSGLTGAVYGKMTGRGGGQGQRYFTTQSSFGALGFRPGGGGVYQIGVDRGAGHMAGRYGGLSFEAANTHAGIRVGAAARSVTSFPAVYHMAKGGLVEALVAGLAKMPGIAVGGDPGRLRLDQFDRGGWLQPGATLALNRTGRPEPVGLDPDALADALVRALERYGLRVAVDDIHTGLLAKKRGQGRVKLGLD